MTAEPLVWHYGLMAERWAEFITETPELPFLQRAIERFGQPALDLACGTGRLLLPLLQIGIDIDGCDISEDMLEHCRSQVTAAGFSPRLFQQPMHALDLPRRYRTIYICGSFGLSGSRENDLETLRRCYAHLEEAGALLVNIQAEYASAEGWQLWLAENRRELPQPWPQAARVQVAADGSEHHSRFRITDLDPLAQRYRRQVRLEKWVAGELVRAEEYTLQGNIYFKNELQLMLRMVGFREIRVYGDYRDEDATAEHEELILAAIK